MVDVARPMVGHVSPALQRGYKVRAVVRNTEKAAQVFGSKSDDKLEVSVPLRLLL